MSKGTRVVEKTENYTVCDKCGAEASSPQGAHLKAVFTETQPNGAEWSSHQFFDLCGNCKAWLFDALGASNVLVASPMPAEDARSKESVND